MLLCFGRRISYILLYNKLPQTQQLKTANSQFLTARNLGVI